MKRDNLVERLRMPRHDKNLGDKVSIGIIRLELLLAERIEAADRIAGLETAARAGGITMWIELDTGNTLNVEATSEGWVTLKVTIPGEGCTIESIQVG